MPSLLPSLPEKCFEACHQEETPSAHFRRSVVCARVPNSRLPTSPTTGRRARPWLMDKGAGDTSLRCLVPCCLKSESRGQAGPVHETRIQTAGDCLGRQSSSRRSRSVASRAPGCCCVQIMSLPHAWTYYLHACTVMQRCNLQLCPCPACSDFSKVMTTPSTATSAKRRESRPKRRAEFVPQGG